MGCEGSVARDRRRDVASFASVVLQHKAMNAKMRERENNSSISALARHTVLHETPSTFYSCKQHVPSLCRMHAKRRVEARSSLMVLRRW